MQAYRRIIFIALLWLLAACSTNEGETFPTLENAPISSNNASTENIFFPISLDLGYIAPNPGGRWVYFGRSLQAQATITTGIQIIANSKAYPNQAFAEALANITVQPLEFTQVGDLNYAEGTNAIGALIIYRDYPDIVLEFRLMDSLADTVAEQYINDWRIIALQGQLEALN
jgi:hypothetical protein